MALNQVISNAFTEEKLRELLYKKGGFELKNYEFIGGLTKTGDSYLSEVYRLQVEVESSTSGNVEFLNFVIKTMPKNIGRRKTFRSTDFFRNEITFYKNVIPAFEEFQKSRNARNPFKDYAGCFASFCDGENDYLALDDLGQYGFRPTDRHDGLDYDHCRLAVECLARFHSVSIAFRNQEPKKFAEITEKIQETYYSPGFKIWHSNFLKSQIKVVQDAVHNEYPETLIEEKMLKFTQENLFDVLVNATTTKSSLSVIGHGDCWAPNFLVNYETSPDTGSKIPKEIKIIDFQLARYASLSIDLSFFIYVCTTHSLREKHYGDLLQAYHSSCCQMLKDLGSDPSIFPYTALVEEMRKYGRVGVGMAMESLLFSIMPKEDAFDLNIIKGDQAIPIENVWVFQPIPCQEGRLRIADIFKHATEMGYLD
ncbi:uncharacterized protein DMENIID0001_115680 [Sergentomyia squamirostris]